jgi:hypothetical protein
VNYFQEEKSKIEKSQPRGTSMMMITVTPALAYCTMMIEITIMANPETTSFVKRR